MTDEKGRLAVILTCWTEPDRDRGEKFRKRTKKAESTKDDPIDDSISQTARGMEEKYKKPSQSLRELKERD